MFELRMNGLSILNGIVNVSYMDYMDLIIMDVNSVNLLWVKIDSVEKIF